MERDDAADRAIKALARRDHSSATLKAKLTRAGASADVSDEVLATLERAGYVDDARFARERAAQLASRGYGDEWIRGDLETSQGVDADAAIVLLEPEPERAEREWARLGGGVKAVRTLARRGFSEASLEPLLHRTPFEE